MASNPQHEPTMEEILASIRKIISEDANEAPAAAPAPAAVVAKPAPAAAAVVEEEADVLELTHEVEEEPPVAPTPIVQAPVAPAPVMRAAPPPKPPADDVVFQSIEESPVSPTAAPVHSGEGIFSDKSRKAIDDAFAALDDVTPEEPPQPRDRQAPIAPVDGATVEAVFERAVRHSFEPVIREWADSNAEAIVDRMKPLIREWLDEHFPAMLEEAVRGEVARVVKARRR